MEFHLKAQALLAIQVVNPDQPELVPDLSGFETTITMNELLLNAGDRFDIIALVSGFENGVIAKGRIYGVKTIERKVLEQKISTWLRVVIAVPSILLILLCLFFLVRDTSGDLMLALPLLILFLIYLLLTVFFPDRLL